jgi:hypothetical protein
MGMRNLLAFLAAAVLTIVGVGLYLGWFTVHRVPAGDGKSGVNIEVDTDKIGDDLHRGGEKLRDALDRARRGGQEASDHGVPPPPPAPPVPTGPAPAPAPFDLELPAPPAPPVPGAKSPR